MRKKFFYGVVIFFMVTFFVFFFRLFRPFVGVVVRPVSQTVTVTVPRSAMVDVAELIKNLEANVDKSI
jgi:hypothetical protein